MCARYTLYTKYIYMVYHCVYFVLDNILVYNTIILDILSIIGNIWPTAHQGTKMKIKMNHSKISKGISQH